MGGSVRRSNGLLKSHGGAGEPMVASAADGYATFLRSEMDAVAIGPFLISRSPDARGRRP